MRKKIFVILIIISTLINIFAAAFIFLDIQVVEAPETTFSMNILEINSKEMIIQTELEIRNPNNFEIIAKKFKIVTSTQDGDEISSLKIDGETIPAKENKIFIENVSINFKGIIPEALVSKTTGIVGMKIGFIEKTLPVSVTVKSNIENIVKDIVPPKISMTTNFGEITQKNINLSVEIESYNSNSFDMYMEDILIEVKNESGFIVGTISIPSVKHKADSSIKFNGTGLILIEALNAKFLIANLNSNITASIAGFNKTLPFNINSKLNLPDLKTLLPSTFPTDTVIRSDYRGSILGLVNEITLETYNPHNIEFHVKDMTIEIYRIDRKTRRKVSEGTIEGGILKANNVTTLKGKVIIPYRKLFIPPLGGKIFPDWLEVTIRANVTIQGLNNYFWIGMIAYQDFHIWKKDKVYKNPQTADWM